MHHCCSNVLTRLESNAKAFTIRREGICLVHPGWPNYKKCDWFGVGFLVCMSCDWILAIPRIYSAEACATASLPSRFRSEGNITFPRHVFRSYFARKSRCLALVMGLNQRAQGAKIELTSGSAEGLRLLHSDGG